jgi:hypothetical protein
MSTAVAIARLNTTVTGDVISSATNGSTVVLGTGTHGVVCAEAIAICHCLAVSSSGIFPVTIEGSTDGGTTFTTQGTFGAVSATGVLTARIRNIAPLIRWASTKTSGTSVTCVIEVIGLQPTDSYLVSDTAIVAA